MYNSARLRRYLSFQKMYGLCRRTNNKGEIGLLSWVSQWLTKIGAKVLHIYMLQKTYFLCWNIFALARYEVGYHLAMAVLRVFIGDGNIRIYLRIFTHYPHHFASAWPSPCSAPDRVNLLQTANRKLLANSIPESWSMHLITKLQLTFDSSPAPMIANHSAYIHPSTR